MNITLQDAAAKLLQGHKFVITAHVNPDGDAIGSCLGLYHILKKLGKEAEVLIDDDLPKNFDFLPGIEMIKKPEADSYAADFLVMLDVSKDRIGRVADKCQAPILNIDHHVTNKGEADYLYLDASKAATAEIIYQLLGELQVKADRAAALCIFTGISTDTGNFKYSNTKPFTLRAAADLLEAGAETNVVSEALERCSYKEIMDKANALQTIETSFDGKVAGLYIDQKLYDTLETTEGYIDSVRVIDGVDIAVLVKEVEPGVCRVSMRSKGIDVTAIATAFGGGGHVRAAGCTIKKPLGEAKTLLLEEIGKHLD